MKDSSQRILSIATYICGAFHQVLGRTSKPWNPLLGETYEFVGPEYRLLVETVSHHPPIICIHLEGQGFSYYAVSETQAKFTGKSIWT